MARFGRRAPKQRQCDLRYFMGVQANNPKNETPRAMFVSNEIDINSGVNQTKRKRRHIDKENIEVAGKIVAIA